MRPNLSLLLLLATAAEADSAALRLKTRSIDTSNQLVSLPLAGRQRAAGRSHYLVQYPALPQTADLQALRARGAVIVGFVPENGLSISVPDGMSFDGLGLRWVGRLPPRDKLSPGSRVGAAQQVAYIGEADFAAAFVVEFHSDVDMAGARALVLEQGIEILDRSFLLPNHLLIAATAPQAAALAEWDEVAYVFAASPDLINGTLVVACPGGATEAALVAQYAQVSQGWPAGAQGAVVGYRFGAVTSRVPALAGQNEIVRAMDVWSRLARVSFAPGVDPAAPQTMNIFFASSSHGDAYPFDGPGKVLGHTFFPSPPNAEPVAGDMHLDADENWNIGSSVDLFSVALHETGHALGLGHSDLPGAVMYPYYKQVAGLAADDIAGIRSLYGERTTPAVDPTPASPGAPSLPPATPPLTPPLRPPATPPSTPPTTPSATPPVTPPVDPPIVPAPSDPGPRLPAPTPAAPPVAPPAAPPGDTVPPSLSITYPAGTIVGTTDPRITISGTASDNAGVTEVRWTNNFGSSGTATGTSYWTASVPLLVGTNSVVIRVFDAAGNSAWRSLTVVRR
ncbi:MAG: matrixin family metalloprotease [Bryobacterales bacterium]|nr:matrixin family metalloprotease [Bryobacterales bacterium]